MRMCTAHASAEIECRSAEQLAGLANDAEKVAAALNEPLVGAVPALPIAEQPLESVVDAAAENDAYALARVYFDTKEYRRAAHVLRNCFQPRSLFLRLYALYFVGLM